MGDKLNLGEGVKAEHTGRGVEYLDATDYGSGYTFSEHVPDFVAEGQTQPRKIIVIEAEDETVLRLVNLGGTVTKPMDGPSMLGIHIDSALQGIHGDTDVGGILVIW